MFTSQLAQEKARETRNHFNPALFEEQVKRHSQEALGHFRLITRYYALFHLGFFVLGLFELFAFLLFFPFFAKSSLLAFSIAAIFLTVFSYFVLRFYFQAKKPEQFLQLKGNFIEACKKSIPFELGKSEYHLTLTHALHRFIALLDGQECQYYPLPKYSTTLVPLMEKFSLWCHWEDVLQMKELLQMRCIRELTGLVKTQATDIEAHGSLATAYCGLYKLYMDPRRLGKSSLYQLLAEKYVSNEMRSKFQKAAAYALEEFKIIDYYSPNDPWVHLQLAAVYHDLELPEKEIKEYETLLHLSSQDKEILLRLGVLYFQQGFAAQGLKIYEQLKKIKDSKAEELISYYDIAFR